MVKSCTELLFATTGVKTWGKQEPQSSIFECRQNHLRALDLTQHITLKLV